MFAVLSSTPASSTPASPKLESYLCPHSLWLLSHWLHCAVQDDKQRSGRGHQQPQNECPPRRSAQQLPRMAAYKNANTMQTSTMNPQAPAYRPANLNWQQRHDRNGTASENARRRHPSGRQANGRQRSEKGVADREHPSGYRHPVNGLNGFDLASKHQEGQQTDGSKEDVDYPACLICTETLKVQAACKRLP